MIIPEPGGSFHGVVPTLGIQFRGILSSRAEKKEGINPSSLCDAIRREPYLMSPFSLRYSSLGISTELAPPP